MQTVAYDSALSSGDLVVCPKNKTDARLLKVRISGATTPEQVQSLKEPPRVRGVLVNAPAARRDTMPRDTWVIAGSIPVLSTTIPNRVTKAV